MKKNIIYCFILSLMLILISTGSCPAEEKISKQDLLRVLDPLVDQTLAAYNSNDDVKFFAYYAQRMHDITNPKYFKEYYAGVYKDNFGDYISRTLLEKKSSFDIAYPVLVYKAGFKKEKEAVVTVTFMNEHGFYRITNVEFTKVYFDD